jgi:tetratricopeptide (TPR) repeat protein
VATDREDSLRRAEKLLRQGRLDGAIQEYARLLEEQPHDWNTRNVLGDLYVRANQVEQAAVQFTQIADHFAREGFLPRAIALYKKVVKIKPDDEHALLQSAEISARQGLLADAKASLAAIADQRRRRGDKSGSNEILLRIATLDPADLGARMSAARAAAEMGDTAGAAGRYKDLAAELFGRDRTSEAIDALAEAVHLDGSDESARNSLVSAYLKRGEIDEARRYASTGAHFKAIADDLSARGQDNEALDALFEAVQRDPGDNATRARLARSLVAQGDLDRAAACLLRETLGEDSELLLLAAEVDLRTGRGDAGRELLRAVMERDSARRDEMVRLGCSLAALDRDVAFQCIDVVTEAAVAARDWVTAAGSLQEFLTHAPAHIPALIKLVDVCVDGDLDEVLSRAQADLAESYLTAGRAFEARVIAEDLVTRAPGDAANVDRFRRALVMLGEADADAIIADRLNPDSSLAMEDLNADLSPPQPSEADSSPAKVLPFSRSAEPGEAGDAEPPSPAPSDDEALAAGRTVRGVPPVPTPSVASVGGRVGPAASPLAAAPVEEMPDLVAAQPVQRPDAAAARAPQVAAGDAGQQATRPGDHVPAALAREKPRADTGRGDSHAVYDLSAAAIDVNAILAGDKGAQPQPGASSDPVEIDLSSVLREMGNGQPSAHPAGAPTGASAAAPVKGRDLDDVFEELRQEVVKEKATNTAAQHYKLALTYHDMGMIDECIKALEVAARSPRYRFQAASLLGRIHRHHGRTHEAIDWFERAAEAPAASAEAGRALLYELGQALEDEGESVRALAVYLELQADAGDYRDVSARIKRLSR